MIQKTIKGLNKPQEAEISKILDALVPTVKNISQDQLQHFSNAILSICALSSTPATPTINISSTNDETAICYDKITAVIKELGFKPHLSGYHLIRTGVMIMLTEPQLFNNRIIKLYQEIGKRHNKDYHSCEHCIRHAIRSTYSANKDTWHKYFPTINQAPNNGELLYTLFDLTK